MSFQRSVFFNDAGECMDYFYDAQNMGKKVITINTNSLISHFLKNEIDVLGAKIGLMNADGVQ